MTDIASLGLSIRSDGVVVATDRLNKFSGAGERAESVSGSLARAAARVGIALAGAFSVSVLSQYADAWSDMQSRVGAAVKNMEAAPALMQRMVDLANASYSPLEQTVEVYTRNVGVLRDLGVSAAGAADFTESLNHMLVITATRGERAASVQNALSKAMATGKLAGDGLETVLANGGRVAEALANELGTTVSGLRGMASQGKITGDAIKNALLNSLDQVREEAAEMPATIGDAFTRIQTNTTALVGTLDQAWGVSGRVAEQMLAMADGIRASADTYLRLGNIVEAVVGPAFDLLSANMDLVGKVSAIAFAGIAGFYAPATIHGVWALATAISSGVVGALKSVALVMMANPITLFIAGLTAGVTAAFIFRDEIKQAIGIDVVEVFRDGANTVIGAMVGAVNASQAAWEVFPDFMAGLGARAWNSFLEGFEGSAISWTNPFTGEKFDLLNIDLTSFKKDAGGAGGAAISAVQQAFQSAQGVDYVGALSSALGDVWTNADGATGAMNALMDSIGGGSGGGAGGAGSGSGKESPYAKLIRGAHEFIAAQTLEQQALGMTAEAAARMRYEQDLLNKAANDNIALTPAMRNELAGLAAQMAATEAQTKMLTQAANDNAALWGSVQDGVSGILKTWARGGDILDTIKNKLLDIADMLIDMAVRNLFMGAFGGGGMGGGGGRGLLGGMIIPGILHSGGVAGASGYGHDRAFPSALWDGAPRYHNGTMGAGLGPNEIPAILERGEIVLPANTNVARQRVQIDVSISVDEGGNIIPLVRQVSGEEADIRVAQSAPVIAGAARAGAAKDAPGAVARYQQQRGGSDFRTM